MQKLIIFVVLLVAAGLFAMQSVSPIYRLRPVMPPEFVDAPSSWPAEKRAEEERLANHRTVETDNWTKPLRGMI